MQIENRTSPISLVMPVYNEAGCIESVVRGLQKAVIDRVPGSEFIVAEDGSTDGTKQILARLQQELAFKLVSGEQRKGYTRAVLDALRLPTHDTILFTDSDGQHDPADFFKLIPYLANNDLVIGWKKPRNDSWHRRLLSWGYNRLISILFGLHLHDIDCGFRVMRKTIVDTILPQTRTLKQCVSSEYVIRAHLAGHRICEVPVTHFARPCGTTNIFHPRKLPGICIGLVQGLLEIKREAQAAASMSTRSQI